MVTWREDEGSAEPSSAIVIEIAPVPRASHTPEEIPPGPLQEMSEATPNKPVETLEDKLKVEQKVEAKPEHKVAENAATERVEEPPPGVAPAPNPEVAINLPPPQEIQQESVMRQTPRIASTASAPQVIAEEVDEVPAAPTQDHASPEDTKALIVWQKQIASVLKKNLRYPSAADRRGHTGTVQVLFGLDRQGRVTDSRVVTGSGVAELDEEALAVVKRSEPFPAPPAAMKGHRVGMNVPISFLPPGSSSAAKR
jgi:periplasmic protein TonB